ncbi:PREDICTED: retinoblastoma-like protein 2 [Amphimedon queenslandica]|uniref:Uncharacterized protein n=2 Tax=Amphimedon queenslandica TaxID=400682 RepID=A0AAN0JZ57_AMPQE|nr:PREDICTED: retinoblastoma-like protein 2 [Amphimedon queenslandica]|eukprot:XP_019862495.1 PREDICTED: retinoblastoma-like protein 2 [Amphimedon queenslandica]
MLEEGEFDERVFLNSSETDHEEEELLGRSDEKNERLEPIGVIYQSPQYLQYGTPLSGREYLSTRENKLTPVSDANQSVIQLHLLLEESLPEPTDIIYNTCRYINSLLTLIY